MFNSINTTSPAFKQQTQSVNSETQTKTVNFKQSMGQDSVELSNKKEGMSTGAKAGIAVVGITGLAAVADALFNKGRLRKKLFGTAKEKIDDILPHDYSKAIKNNFAEFFKSDNQKEVEASFKRAQEYFKKNPKATTWTDDLAKNPTKYTCERMSKASMGEIKGVTTMADGSTCSISSGCFLNPGYRTFSNNRGTLSTAYGSCDSLMRIPNPNVVEIGKHRIILNAGKDGVEATCSVIENGVHKIYPVSVFEEATDHVINGMPWNIENAKPIVEIVNPSFSKTEKFFENFNKNLKEQFEDKEFSKELDEIIEKVKKEFAKK